MNLVDRGKVYLWNTAENVHGISYQSEPDWFEVTRNFENGSEHFPEWKKFRTMMEDIREGLEGRRGFMT